MDEYHSESFQEHGPYKCHVIENSFEIIKESLKKFDVEKEIGQIGLLKSQNLAAEVHLVPEYKGTDLRTNLPERGSKNFLDFANILRKSEYIGFMEYIPKMEIGFDWGSLMYASEVSFASGKPIVYTIANSTPSSLTFIPKDNIRSYLIHSSHQHNKESDIVDIEFGKSNLIKTFQDIEMFKDIELV